MRGSIHNMRYILLMLGVLPVWGAWDAEVPFMGTNFAILRVKDFTGTCTLDVNTYNGGLNLPQVDYHSGATDALHSDTTVTADKRTKYIILGHNPENLSSGQPYFVNVSGCGGNKTIFFNTKRAQMGAIAPRVWEGDVNNAHGVKRPEIDWSANGADTYYTDPATGMELRLVSKPEDYSWAHKTDQTFSFWAGATSGWSNTGTIVNGSTSTATTTSTNQIYLYPAIGNPWAINEKPQENIGVQLWGQCTGASVGTDDCKLVMYVFDTPGSVPSGVTPIEIAVTGTFAAITAGASSFSNSPANIVSTNTFPSAYPRPHMAGWGSFFRLTSQKRIPAANGTISTTAAGVLTITNPTSANNFPSELKAGDHIWINGAGSAGTPCVAAGGTDICTVAAHDEANVVSLTEAVTLGAGTASRPLPWGVALYKKTGVGTIRVGAKFRLSGGTNSSTGTLAATCGPLEITRSDGVKGHSCLIPERNAYTLWYFISNDGKERHMIDGLQVAAIGGSVEAVTFDPTNERRLYGVHKSTGNLYRLHYSGDWGVTPTLWEQDPPSGARYSVNFGGDYPAATWSSPAVTATVVINNVSSKITAAYPQFVAAPYTAWNGAFFGVSGDLAFYGRVLPSLGQDTGGCQIAAFNLNSNTIIDFINSADEPGAPTKFGMCHSFSAFLISPNTLRQDMNIIGNKGGNPNVSRVLAGPHRMRILGVLRSGVFDTVDTSLPWPTTTAYDRACPAAIDMPAGYDDVGAQSNNCVTLKVQGSTAAKVICNEYGNNTANGGGDRLIYGTCEWDTTTTASQSPPASAPTYSGGPPLEVGMKFVDRSDYGGAPGDQENFRVVKITPTGDGVSMTVVAQRNASRQKCCAVNGTVSPSSTDCLQGDSALQHADGWDAMFVAGTYGSCNQFMIYTRYNDPTDGNSKQYIEVPIRLAEGHSGVGVGPGDTFTYMGGRGDRTFSDFADLGIQPPPATRTRDSNFNLQNVDIGGVIQQYIGAAQLASPDHMRYFGGDANSVNPGVGIGGNIFGNYIGTRAGDTFTQVSGRLWRVGITGSEDKKNKSIIGWCGPKQLTDISSPSTGNLIDIAPDYSMCRAYNNNECRTGSTSGMTWVTCPNVGKITTSVDGQPAHHWVQTGLHFQEAPAVLSVQGNAGYVRTFSNQRPDAGGSNQRLVSNFMMPPGAQFPFWSETIHPSGQSLLAPSGGWQDGIKNVYWVATLPKQPKIFPQRNSFRYTQVQVGDYSGVTHARIKFGNNPSFHCNPNYRTACYTDSVLVPYAFSNESFTPNTCAGGCILYIPAWPNEPLWYQLQVSTDGTNFTDKEQVKVVVP